MTGVAQALIDQGFFSSNFNIKVILELFDDYGLDNPYKNLKQSVISFDAYRHRVMAAKRKQL